VGGEPYGFVGRTAGSYIPPDRTMFCPYIIEAIICRGRTLFDPMMSKSVLCQIPEEFDIQSSLPPRLLALVTKRPLGDRLFSKKRIISYEAALRNQMKSTSIVM